MPDDELLTVAEVLAELHNVSRRTFYRWREIGVAPACIRYPNGELRIKRSVLRSWIKEHEEVST